MTAALLATLALACGCTTVQIVGPDSQGYTWRKATFPIPPEAWFVEFVPAGEVMLHCGLEPKAVACSVRRPGPDGALECHVYVPTNAPNWVLPHEMRHCLGWVHGMPDADAAKAAR